MWFNLICYQLKINLFTYITDISEPHGDHKVKKSIVNTQK